MKRVTGRSLCSLLACAALSMAAGCATTTAPAARPAASDAATAGARVAVSYVNPEDFSEARQFGQQDRFRDVDYLTTLKTHLIKRATRMLPAGDRLDVTVTDIKLAGAYEPWQGPNLMYVRFMKDVYPPRINLTFKLIGSDGTVLREGSRKLSNLGYLHSGVGLPGDTDPLRYDKALIDSWLRRGPADL